MQYPMQYPLPQYPHRPHLVGVEAKGAEQLLHQVQHPPDLITNLTRQAEDVRVVLRVGTRLAGVLFGMALLV